MLPPGEQRAGTSAWVAESMNQHRFFKSVSLTLAALAAAKPLRWPPRKRSEAMAAATIGKNEEPPGEIVRYLEGLSPAWYIERDKVQYGADRITVVRTWMAYLPLESSAVCVN